MKDYKKIAAKISKMASFSNIHQCGIPTVNFPVNLYFELCEPYIIGYKFYVSYTGNVWGIEYTLDNSIDVRAKMNSIRNIKTDKEMYLTVENIINDIRERCGVERADK